jgi:hypothetical protein
LDSLDSYIVEEGVTLVGIISASSDSGSLNCSVEGIDGDRLQCTFLSGAAELSSKRSSSSVDAKLAFKLPPSFEFPSDWDHNNIYDITLVMWDSTGATAKQDIHVMVVCPGGETDKNGDKCKTPKSTKAPKGRKTRGLNTKEIL